MLENLAIATLEQRAAAGAFLREQSLMDRVACYERLAGAVLGYRRRIGVSDEIGTRRRHCEP